MVILGIDGSLRCTGWGVIEGTRTAARAKAWGTIPMAASEPHSACLLAIRETVDGLLADARPDAVSMEEGFFAKNARTAIILGEVRGVVISCAAAAGVPIYGYSPRDAKQAVTGWGAAGKRDGSRLRQPFSRRPHLSIPGLLLLSESVGWHYFRSARHPTGYRRRAAGNPILLSHRPA